MGWVRADIVFGDRRANFYVTARQMFEEKALFSELSTVDAKDPDALYKVVREYVVGLRPALQGCVIMAMVFDNCRNRWEFMVSHESLPVVSLYDSAPSIPLDPSRESPPPYSITKATLSDGGSISAFASTGQLANIEPLPDEHSRMMTFFKE